MLMSSHLAPDAKLSGAGATFIFGGGVIYIWHVLSTSHVLAVAISCIACVWCGPGLYHVARVSGQVWEKVV